MDIFLYCLLALLTVTLLAAAFYDLTRFTIPNEISYVVMGLFAVVAMAQFSLPLILTHLASGLIVFAGTFALWHLRLMGGGDVKFWAAAALWFDLADLLQQTLAVALAGGLVALALISLRRGLACYVRTTGREEMEAQLPRGLRVGGPVPYGVAIAAGTLWALYTVAPGYFTPILSVA